MRIAVALLCILASAQTLSAPAGYGDRAWYFFLPFGAAVIASLFIAKLRPLRAHLVWALLLAVVMHQAHVWLSYERDRADENQKLAQQLWIAAASEHKTAAGPDANEKAQPTARAKALDPRAVGRLHTDPP